MYIAMLTGHQATLKLNQANPHTQGEKLRSIIELETHEGNIIRPAAAFIYCSTRVCLLYQSIHTYRI